MRKKLFGKDNPMWKGDQVGYEGIHAWIKRRLPRPPYCEKCNEKHNKLDLANISGKYLRRLDDWEYLCRRCHMLSDGRMNNLQDGNERTRLKPCTRCGALTKGRKYCKDCRKVVRKEWWCTYNKRPKRAEYRRAWNREHR